MLKKLKFEREFTTNPSMNLTLILSKTKNINILCNKQNLIT